MRIIHLVRSKNWGGGEQYALDLCRASVKDENKVTVISRGIPSVDNHFQISGIEMKKMPLGGILDFVSPFKLARLIRSLEEKEVIIHVHNFKDAEIVARAKPLIGNSKIVKLVVTRHLVVRGKRSARWKSIFNAIDRLIFVSELAKREFLSTNPPIDGGKLAVVHNSITIPGQYENAQPSGLQTPVILLYIGRISPEKGIDVLIKAMAGLKDLPLKLIIAGAGPKEYTDRLYRLAEENGVREKIEWRGFVEDRFKIIRESDICVVPSTTRESFGLTVIEGMSQARPVITTDNGAQPEIIRDGTTGILIRPGEPELLSTAIRKLATDPDLCLRIGEEAMKSFKERFSYPVFYRKIKNNYISLLQS